MHLIISLIKYTLKLQKICYFLEQMGKFSLVIWNKIIVVYCLDIPLEMWKNLVVKYLGLRLQK